MKINPKVEVFYLDTDFLFPETYALRDQSAAKYGFTPVAYKSLLTPEEQAQKYGEALWARDPDLCCELRKVEPNERALKGKRAWISGIRRDQGEGRRETGAAARKRASSQRSMRKALTMRFPLMVSWSSWLRSARLAWLERLELRMRRPIFAEGIITSGSRPTEITASRQSSRKTTQSSASSVKVCRNRSASTEETASWIFSMSFRIVDMSWPVEWRRKKLMDCRMIRS